MQTTENLQALLILAEQKHARMKYDLRALLYDARDALECNYPDVALERVNSLIFNLRQDD